MSAFKPPRYPENEHIIGVACQFPTPDELLAETWEGKPVYPFWITVTLPAPYRHGHILHPTNIAMGKIICMTQGFLTSTGRFVPRDEAWNIADLQEQIIAVTGSPGVLYSEDLW